MFLYKLLIGVPIMRQMPKSSKCYNNDLQKPRIHVQPATDEHTQLYYCPFSGKKLH